MALEGEQISFVEKTIKMIDKYGKTVYKTFK